jgi:polar amino acid transport system substrate-binding protein
MKHCHSQSPLRSLFLFIVLSFAIVGCGSSSITSTTSVVPSSQQVHVTAPNDLITSGVLTVGSDTTYPPQEFIDPQSKQDTGFDVDLITAMASYLGLKTNVVTAGFDSIIDSLNAKRFDVVISAITVNPERQQKVNFVNYFNAGESLLVTQGNPKNLQTVADLCGLKVGVQTGTVEQQDLTTADQACVKSGKPHIQLTVLQSQDEVVNLLANNRVDATYQDSPVTDYYIKLHPGQFSVGGSVVNAAVEGIAIRKSDTSMLMAMQVAFDVLKINGTYHQLIVKWGLTKEELQ